jgi:uncharacterized protein YjbJ (UPF0337 family)
MAESTPNEIAGKMHKVKGVIKQKLGEITDNPELEIEGTTENLAGHLQDKLGQVQKVAEEP